MLVAGSIELESVPEDWNGRRMSYRPFLPCLGFGVFNDIAFIEAAGATLETDHGSE